MGVRIYFAKKYQVDWEGGDFNGEAKELFEYLNGKLDGEYETVLQSRDMETGITGYYDDWDMEKDAVELLISDLEKLSPADVAWGEGSCTVTVEYVLDWLKMIFKHADPDNNTIKFSWF